MKVLFLSGFGGGGYVALHMSTFNQYEMYDSKKYNINPKMSTKSVNRNF